MLEIPTLVADINTIVAMIAVGRPRGRDDEAIACEGVWYDQVLVARGKTAMANRHGQGVVAQGQRTRAAMRYCVGNFKFCDLDVHTYCMGGVVQTSDAVKERRLKVVVRCICCPG